MVAKNASDLKETAESVTMTKERRLVVLESLWEIASLCDLLIDQIPKDGDNFQFVARGVILRINNLAEWSSQAISDDAVETEHLIRRVTGKITEVEEV